MATMIDEKDIVYQAEFLHDRDSEVQTVPIYQERNEKGVCIAIHIEGKPWRISSALDARNIFSYVIGLCDTSKGGWCRMLNKNGQPIHAHGIDLER